MSINQRFRRIYRWMMPSWLSSADDGLQVQHSLGITIDAQAERTYQGVKARFPDHCPADALPPMSRDRKIIRGINEPADAFAERLIRWLDDHRVRGNPYALLDQLQAFLQTAMVIRTVDNRGNWFTIDADGNRSALIDQGNWDWDGDTASWSRFWVILYPPSTLWLQDDPAWGDADLWGGEWGRAGYTWGSTATSDEVDGVRTIIRQWKPAGTLCLWIILAFDPTDFDPANGSPPNPDGDWGQWHEAGSDPAVPVREENASYWDGS
jgi:hypothetical protein